MSLVPAVFRLKFPALRRWTYLDSAQGGPLPLEVLRAGCEPFESQLQHGDQERDRLAGAVEQARRDLAALVGCRTRELAFTQGTSHGAALVSDMLWEAGARRVVAFEDEFPALTIPFLHRGFTVQFVARGEDDDLAARLDAAVSKADVLVASHVQYASGRVVDPAQLTAIAEEHGALFVAGLTQSVGALAFDFRASGAHFAIGSGRTWLCGGSGGGYLVVRDLLLGKLRWPHAGWRSVADPEALRNDAAPVIEDARAMELGGAAYPVTLALGAAARLWLEADPEDVQARVRSLTARLRAGLRGAGFDAPALGAAALSGITTVPVADATEVALRLRDRGIAVSARGAGIRFAVHAFNDESDLTKAVAALADAVRG